MRDVDENLLRLARQPWTMSAGRHPLVVRPSAASDLAAVARLHARCSAHSLLDRYRRGGQPPAVVALDRMLRGTFSFVALSPDGEIRASAVLAEDGGHHWPCVEVGLLVEDGWQRRGIGSDLLSHLAGVAHAAGYQELIAYPATATAVVQRLMIEVGRSRFVPDVEPHLHTHLSPSATLGLGPVRQRLAG